MLWIETDDSVTASNCGVSVPIAQTILDTGKGQLQRCSSLFSMKYRLKCKKKSLKDLKESKFLIYNHQLKYSTNCKQKCGIIR